jgi:hypothetical protein
MPCASLGQCDAAALRGSDNPADFPNGTAPLLLIVLRSHQGWFGVACTSRSSASQPPSFFDPFQNVSRCINRQEPRRVREQIFDDQHAEIDAWR